MRCVFTARAVKEENKCLQRTRTMDKCNTDRVAGILAGKGHTI